MNAAARVLAQGNIFRSEWYDITFSKQVTGLALLLLFILSSAISLVYMKNLQQQYFNELQMLRDQANQSQLEWHQLLAEQGTWTAPAYLQHAANQNAVRFSQPYQVVIVNTSR